MKKVRALIQIDYNEIISTPKQDDIDRNDENQTSQSPVENVGKIKIMKTKLPQWKMLCASLGRRSAPASTWRWPSTTCLSTTTNIIIVTVVGIHHQSCQLDQLQWFHNSHNVQQQDCHSRRCYKSHHVQVCVDGSEEKCSTRMDKVRPLLLNKQGCMKIETDQKRSRQKIEFFWMSPLTIESLYKLLSKLSNC